MSTDFAVNQFLVPFEGADSKNNMKILVGTFWPKNLGFLGVGSPKKWLKSKVCPILMKFGFSRVLISNFGSIVVSFEFLRSCAWVPRRLCFLLSHVTRHGVKRHAYSLIPRNSTQPANSTHAIPPRSLLLIPRSPSHMFKPLYLRN